MQDKKIHNENFSYSGDEYAPFLSLAEQHSSFTYAQFDAKTVKDLNLFALPEDFNFDELNQTADKIIAALPYIKRVFSKPITRITDVSQIVPVESVKKITNETVTHASIHSELWEDINRNGIKPRKLLSQEFRDNYALYENIVFARTIDMIIRFVGRNIRFLYDILYSNRNLQFNLLERENHMSYFLAIGKLHTSYIRDHVKYNSVAENCMDKLIYIERVIDSRLKLPVYRYCKKFSGKLELKKTNIFRMHKDYRVVYQLAKWFSETKHGEIRGLTPRSSASDDAYFMFCLCLTLFSVGHFNFEFAPRKRLNFPNLSATAVFLDWKLTVSALKVDGNNAIELGFEKDREYRVLLLPSYSDRLNDGLPTNSYGADEIIYLSVLSDDNVVKLSLYDIESFRRIQQILLRGMIYSDTQRNACAFCGQNLSLKGEIYECDSCHTQIIKKKCPELNGQYFITDIKNFKPKEISLDVTSRKDRTATEQKIASSMHYRNIVEISYGQTHICPVCNHIHKTK